MRGKYVFFALFDVDVGPCYVDFFVSAYRSAGRTASYV